jgi:transposase-like protein
MAKKKTKPESYNKSYAQKVIILVKELGCVNQRGQIAWEKIAKILDVSVQTIKRWRDPLSEYYKKDFAEAVKKATESVELDKIKRSMVQKAKGYTRIKVTKELKGRGKKKKLQITKTETEKITGDVAAAKLCAANMGPEDERWTDKSEINIPGGIKLNMNIKKNYADTGTGKQS